MRVERSASNIGTAALISGPTPFVAIGRHQLTDARPRYAIPEYEVRHGIVKPPDLPPGDPVGRRLAAKGGGLSDSHLECAVVILPPMFDVTRIGLVGDIDSSAREAVLGTRELNCHGCLPLVVQVAPGVESAREEVDRVARWWNQGCSLDFCDRGASPPLGAERGRPWLRPRLHTRAWG